MTYMWGQLENGAVLTRARADLSLPMSSGGAAVNEIADLWSSKACISPYAPLAGFGTQ